MNDDNALIVRGQVVDDDSDTEIESLRADNQRLRRDLTIANGEIARAKSDAARAMGALRKQLSPLYRALQAVFGELDEAGIHDGQTTDAMPSRTSAVWESWKSRLPGGPAKIIDALLLHSEMNTQQLAIATGVHRNSIPAMIYKLNKAGLLNKNGQRFSLKQL